MTEAYTPEEARSPSYWRGRAQACLDALALVPEGQRRRRAVIIGQAAMYDRIAEGLDREMVDVDAILAKEEGP